MAGRNVSFYRIIYKYDRKTPKQKENKTNVQLLNAVMNQNCKNHQGRQRSSPYQFSVNRLGILTWEKESKDDSQLGSFSFSCLQWRMCCEQELEVAHTLESAAQLKSCRNPGESLQCRGNSGRAEGRMYMIKISLFKILPSRGMNGFWTGKAKSPVICIIFAICMAQLRTFLMCHRWSGWAAGLPKVNVRN